MYSIDEIEKNLLESVEFPAETFPSVCGRDSFYRKCISLVEGREGLFLEFGVFQGGTINFLSSLIPNKKFYGFDSFEGLPEDWVGIVGKGHFKTNIPKVNDNVDLVVGWFDETLDKFLEEHDETISFVHLDADLYSSIDYVLKKIENKIEDKCLFIFDDFLQFPNYKEHSIKCFYEFLKRTNYTYTPVGYVKEDFSRCAFIINVNK
jgi:hypothetical protein